MSEVPALGSAPPTRALRTLVERYDSAAFEPDNGSARIRLAVTGGGAWDAVLEHGGASFARPEGDADATLTAGPSTWDAIARDDHGGVRAFQAGRLEAVSEPRLRGVEVVAANPAWET
jgi:putative sterol carrier protein